jgi:hypothetical protein
MLHGLADSFYYLLRLEKTFIERIRGWSKVLVLLRAIRMRNARVASQARQINNSSEEEEEEEEKRACRKRVYCEIRLSGKSRSSSISGLSGLAAAIFCK